MSNDLGYVSLIVMLVIVPITAVLAAVIDRMIVRRRHNAGRHVSDTRGAFPVIPVSSARPNSGASAVVVPDPSRNG